MQSAKIMTDCFKSPTSIYAYLHHACSNEVNGENHSSLIPLPCVSQPTFNPFFYRSVWFSAHWFNY